MREMIVVSLAGIAAVLLTAAPGFAQQLPPVSMPEPASMTVLGLGVGALALVRGIRRKK